MLAKLQSFTLILTALPRTLNGAVAHEMHSLLRNRVFEQGNTK